MLRRITERIELIIMAQCSSTKILFRKETANEPLLSFFVTIRYLIDGYLINHQLKSSLLRYGAINGSVN